MRILPHTGGRVNRISCGVRPGREDGGTPAGTAESGMVYWERTLAGEAGGWGVVVYSPPVSTRRGVKDPRHLPLCAAQSFFSPRVLTLGLFLAPRTPKNRRSTAGRDERPVWRIGEQGSSGLGPVLLYSRQRAARPLAAGRTLRGVHVCTTHTPTTTGNRLSLSRGVRCSLCVFCCCCR